GGAMQHDILEVEVDGVLAAERPLLLAMMGGGTDVGGHRPLTSAPGDLARLFGGPVEGDEARHGDDPACLAVAGGCELLAVMATLARQVLAGGVGVHQDR